MPFELRALITCIPYLRLEVAGATQLSSGTWIADYNPAGGNVTITAYAPLATPIVWAIANGVGAPGLNGDTYDVPLNNALNINPMGTSIQVTATAGPLTQTVSAEVKPLLTGLDWVAGQYAFVDPNGGWYAYDLSGPLGAGANAITANLQAAVQPSTANAWTHLVWTAATTALPLAPMPLIPINGNQVQGIPLDATRNLRVTVEVSGSTQAIRQQDLDVRPPGNGANGLANSLGLTLDAFTFAGAGRFSVAQEDNANFNQPYPALWQRNPARSPPQGYSANSALSLNGITLGVANAPTAPTQVQARACILLANPGGAGPILLQATSPAVAVNPGVVLGASAVLGTLVLGNLPNRVMRLTPLLIFWEVSTNAGRAWSPLAVTESPVYVTAQMPVATTRGPLNSGAGPVFTYLSLVDMSCGSAEGQAGGPGNASAVKAAIYSLFNPANPNPQVRRLNAPAGPPSNLIYWWNHAAGAQPAQSLNGRSPLPPFGGGDLFSNPNSNIACGVWADLLIAMWALHGDGTAHKIQVMAASPANRGANALANVVNGSVFLVRNWLYGAHGALDANNYTHQAVSLATFNAVSQVAAPDPVAGQNNPTPPEGFENHYIVLDTTTGNFYDPSYGTVPQNRNGWVTVSLAGLAAPRLAAPRLPLPVWDAGFATAFGPNPSDIDPNLQSVALRDEMAGNWIP